MMIMIIASCQLPVGNDDHWIDAWTCVRNIPIGVIAGAQEQVRHQITVT